MEFIVTCPRGANHRAPEMHTRDWALPSDPRAAPRVRAVGSQWGDCSRLAPRSEEGGKGAANCTPGPAPARPTPSSLKPSSSSAASVRLCL